MAGKGLELRVANLDCEHDAAAIERGLAGFPGLKALKVYPKAAKVALDYDPAATTPEALREKLEGLGFPVQKGMTMAEQPKPWRNPKVITSVVSGLLLLVGWLISLAGVPESVSTVLYLASLLTGGYYFGREAIEELIFERSIGIELLMTIAAVVATALGLAAEGAMLAFLYSISEAAEGYTEEKTRAAIKALMNLAPKVALVRRGEPRGRNPGRGAGGRRHFHCQARSVNRYRRRDHGGRIERQPGAGDRRERAGREAGGRYGLRRLHQR